MNGKIFIELIETAIKNRWCTSPYCTTCGCYEFRKALMDISERDFCGTLIDDLCSLDVVELTSYPIWLNCLRLYTHTIQFPGQYPIFLRAWLPQMERSVRFADGVLYHVVRKLQEDFPEKRSWIEKCIDLALRTTDHSLIESLLLCLKGNVSEHPKLIRLAEKIAVVDKKVAKVLAKTKRLTM